MEKLNSTSSSDVSIKSYVIGFILSIVFTIIPFWAVAKADLGTSLVVLIIFVSAIIQLLIQLLFFMHLGAESKPRLHLGSFIFSVMMILIIVIGSIWIMYSLDHIANTKEQNKATEVVNTEHDHTEHDHTGHNHSEHDHSGHNH